MIRYRLRQTDAPGVFEVIDCADDIHAIAVASERRLDGPTQLLRGDILVAEWDAKGSLHVSVGVGDPGPSRNRRRPASDQTAAHYRAMLAQTNFRAATVRRA